jgi:radical SAM superfamily enzyme YgiQ (UPF0313 family)
MRITFLRPHLIDARSGDAMQPLAFAVLAGVTPPDIETDFFDERLEELPLEHSTDLVAITVETYTARRAYQIARHFRRRSIPVVMGGYHPTFLPEEALRFADAVVLGEAEDTWPQVVEDARRGRLQRIYRSTSQPSLTRRCFDRKLFAGKAYKFLVPVQYGCGCRFACDFCSIHSFYGSYTHQRPLNEVIAEIEALHTRHILFIDDNLLVDRQKVLQLCEALTPLRIKWGCQISIDAANDETLLKAMARSGCIMTFIGFESLNMENMHSMRKGWVHKQGSYREAIHKFHANGILIWGSFVFGYDHDTPDVFNLTAEFAIDAHLALVNFLTITPTPGTLLYQRLEKEARLLFPRWWLDSNYRYGQAVFRPAKMTPEQLTEGCLRARRMFYSYSSIFKRSWDSQCNSSSFESMLLYWATNLLYRREMTNKLGHRLGSSEPLSINELQTGNR